MRPLDAPLVFIVSGSRTGLALPKQDVDVRANPTPRQGRVVRVRPTRINSNIEGSQRSYRDTLKRSRGTRASVLSGLTSRPARRYRGRSGNRASQQNCRLCARQSGGAKTVGNPKGDILGLMVGHQPIAAVSRLAVAGLGRLERPCLGPTWLQSLLSEPPPINQRALVFSEPFRCHSRPFELDE
jgi:hypothetical protein